MKNLYLLVLEERHPIRKPLATIDFITGDYRINQETCNQHWKLWTKEEGIRFTFTPEELIETYFESMEKIHALFQPLSRYTNFPLYDKIKSISVTFAEKSAYNAFLSHYIIKYPHLSGSFAFYHTKEGIFQRISNIYLNTVQHHQIHELGHALDHLFTNNNNKLRTQTMAEVIAIFVEETLGFKGEYVTPQHREAQGILRRLASTHFCSLSFSEQWEFLSNIFDHNDDILYSQKPL